MAMADLLALERETDEMRVARVALSQKLERILSPTSMLSGDVFQKALDFAKDSGWKEKNPPKLHCTVEQFLSSYDRNDQ